MKQVLQDLKKGRTYLQEVPPPAAQNGQVLIQNRASLISVGTEKMLMNFGKASLLDKARQQPDKVKQVLDKVRTDGLMQTYDAVKSKLNQPLPLGYSCAGVVLDGGSSEFKTGDRVIANGHHAEVCRCPKNLVAKIPDNVSDEAAAFTVVAAIGLQGVRLAMPSIGEKVVVIGLGLIGLLTAQILRANGCQVLGFDFSPDKVDMARSFGIHATIVTPSVDVVQEAMQFSGGTGVDAVLITASTSSNDPVTQAAKMSRKRGRIVLVGVVGLNLSRADFYEKELSFQVSCSYGPGRYDPEYEDKGNDYPVGFVRWTQQRNFEAILALMASGQLNVEPLISHRFDFDDAQSAYAALDSEDVLGAVLNYPTELAQENVVSLNADAAIAEQGIELSPKGKCNTAVIGAGNYAGRVLIPALKQAGANLQTVVSSGGLSSSIRGQEHGFQQASTDASAAMQQDSVDMVVIATQHHLHAEQVIEALGQGKAVFVEKPLAITQDSLQQIADCYQQLPEKPQLMVGFNRRFAPQITQIKSLLCQRTGPKHFVMTVNAGAIPAEHWTQDPDIGGGRLIGEACHFVDLLRFLAGAPISQYQAVASPNPQLAVSDNISITLSFADGSLGTIHYLSDGHSSFAKERLEVFCGGGVLQLDNFRKLKGYGWRGCKNSKLWRQDKGQNQCIERFVKAVQTGNEAPIPFDELMEVAEVTIALSQQVTR